MSIPTCLQSWADAESQHRDSISPKMPRAAGFNFNARQAKQNFVNSVNPDYVIIDITGNMPQWSSDLSAFERDLCR